MAESKYCRECRRKHPSTLWYGVGNFKYCGGAYVRMFRQKMRVCHPSWPAYEHAAHETDETGARICAAVYRKDATAIREGTVLMTKSMLSPRMRILVSLLASTFYFSWPAHAFILRIVGLAREPNKADLTRIGAEVFKQFAEFRVLGGHLVPRLQTRGSIQIPCKGISCTKNPSERRCGSARFKEILVGLKGVLAMLDRMMEYFASNNTVSLAAMLKVLGKTCIYKSVVSYKSVRGVRILAEAAGKVMKDCPEDLDVFRKMTSHMKYALKKRGLNDYKTCAKFVEGMKETTHLPEYTLNDLIIYTCLLDKVVFDE
jgi:hypothetical protein